MGEIEGAGAGIAAPLQDEREPCFELLVALNAPVPVTSPVSFHSL